MPNGRTPSIAVILGTTVSGLLIVGMLVTVGKAWERSDAAFSGQQAHEAYHTALRPGFQETKLIAENTQEDVEELVRSFHAYVRAQDNRNGGVDATLSNIAETLREIKSDSKDRDLLMETIRKELLDEMRSLKFTD